MQATAQKELGKYDLTAGALFEARRIIETLPAAEPARTVMVSNALGALCHNLGDYDSAERFYRASVEAAAKSGNDSQDLAVSKDLLGRLLADEGYLAEAQLLIPDSLAMRERLSGAASTGVAFGRLTIGYMYLSMGRVDLAAANYRAARDLYAKLHQSDRAPMSRLAAMDLNGVFEDVGSGVRVEGEGADPTARAEEIRLGGLERTPVISLRNRGRLMYRATPPRATEADERFARAIEIDRRVGGSALAASEAHTRRVWGECLLAAGEMARAEEQLRLAIDLQRTSLTGECRPVMAQTLLALGELLTQAGRAGEAVPMIEEAIGLRTALAGKDSWTVGVALAAKGEAMTALKKYPEAEALLKEAYQLVNAGLGRENPRTVQIRELLRGLYQATGETGKAAELR